jgi:hypothetical protein
MNTEKPIKKELLGGPSFKDRFRLAYFKFRFVRRPVYDSR